MSITKCKLCNNNMLSFLRLKECELLYCDTCFIINKICEQKYDNSHKLLNNVNNNLQINVDSQGTLHVLHIFNNTTLDVLINGCNAIIEEYEIGYSDMLSWRTKKERQMKYDIIVLDGIFDYLDEFEKVFDYIKQISCNKSKIYINVTHCNIIKKTSNIFFTKCKNIWTTNSMRQLCAKHGFLIRNINMYDNTDYCTYEISKSNENEMEGNDIFTLMIDELEREIYSTELYDMFQYRFLMYINTFLNFILYCKMNSHKTLIAYGTQEQIELFNNIYSNYRQFFDYIVSDENKYDILEQIRHQDYSSNTVILILFDENYDTDFKTSLNELCPYTTQLKLFEIEGILTFN